MKSILFLHGAMGSKVQLQPLMDCFADRFNVYSINFSGHGGESLPVKFSIKLFANDVIKWLEKTGHKQINIFGFSMGGYVAVYLAKYYPAVVESIITLGTKWQWDKASAAKETAMLQPAVIEQKVPKFADSLQQVHYPQDWKEIMLKTAAMLTEMSAVNPLPLEGFKGIKAQVLLMLGDGDKMVTQQETLQIDQQIALSQLVVLQATPHFIEQADVKMISTIIINFLKPL